ncbi:MAG: HD domain-containing protein [Lachnospiraceae bacterium]|nr:HD domain-containing protein [Lachnospiraceae bacterium]
MNYIKDLQAGDHINSVFLCRQRTSAVTKNGKAYDNCILQDKTGQIDAKIWEPNSEGIGDFQGLDYVEVVGEVTQFNGALQLSIRRARYVKPENVNSSDFFPVSDRDPAEMDSELAQQISLVTEPHLHRLLEILFVEDTQIAGAFKRSSAAKSVHHGFIGGLLEHTLSVTKTCMFFCEQYPVLNKDLLRTAALCHDIGKIRELSDFPLNDYTDEGQFLGHIVIGAEMLDDAIRQIDGFPEDLRLKLIHCILAHHGEYEFGSPKKPALMEAMALHLADNADAKLESFKEALAAGNGSGWIGYSRLFESNIYKP